MSPYDERNLERLVHQALGDLPRRPAPITLEARVQAEVARRAARPWWRKGFAHWPGPARAGFAVLALGAVPAFMLAATRLMARVDVAHLETTLAPEMRFFHAATSLAQTLSTLGGDIIGSIPALWLYGGVATFAALYLALFGLGAAAYRTLYASA